MYSKKTRVEKRDHTGHATELVKRESKMEGQRRKTIILLAVKIWLVILSVMSCKGHQGTPIDNSGIVKLLTISSVLVCDRTTSYDFPCVVIRTPEVEQKAKMHFVEHFVSLLLY